MISRRLNTHLNKLLRNSPAVVMLGPRQAGKTTLALEIGEQTASIYLDLEDENDRAKLANPSKYLADHEDELVILDEVHRIPELFQQLRGIIDRGRRHGKANGRFLLLGSAAMDLLKQSGESLAGRIFYLELGPSMLWRSIRLPLKRSGSGVDFRAAFWPSPTISVCSGGATLSAPIWSAIFLSLAPAYRLRRCGASGPCWRTTRPRFTMPRLWRAVWPSMAKPLPATLIYWLICY